MTSANNEIQLKNSNQWQCVDLICKNKNINPFTFMYSTLYALYARYSFGL